MLHLAMALASICDWPATSGIAYLPETSYTEVTSDNNKHMDFMQDMVSPVPHLLFLKRLELGVGVFTMCLSF